MARRAEMFAVAVRPYLPIVHVAMFVGFVALIAGPAILPQSAFGEELGHVANWLIWTLWFPLVFLSVIVTGRSWCGVLCPMGAASEWVNGFGLKLPVPKWLRWEGTPILTFLAVTVLGQTLGVRDYAGAILEVFGITMLAALVIGFLYGQGQGTRKRAWCRHACPIGLLLGVFSRLGAVDIKPKRPEPGGDAYDTRGLCPTNIDLRRKTESRHCVMCVRCVHPERPGSLTVALRVPGAEVAEIQRHNPSISEVWFMLLGTGVSLGGFLWLVLPQYQTLRAAFGEWAINHGWLWIGVPGPSWLMVVRPEAREVFVWLDFVMIVGFMLGVMLALTAVLVGLQAFAAWIAGRLGARGDFRARFTALGYQIAPAAMISLLLGLGVNLFTLVPHAAAGPVKGAALALAVAWSVWLGVRILSGMGLKGARAAAALAPGVIGGIAVAVAWWPAVFA